MADRNRPEISLKDPYFWGGAMVVFGMMMFVGEIFQSGRISFSGTLLLSVGLCAVFYRDYRRRVDAYRRDRE